MNPAAHTLAQLAPLIGPGPALVPWWVTLPVCTLVVLMIVLHLREMYRRDMPASRRRIRTANSVLLLMLAPTLAYAFGFAPPSNGRAFLLVWLFTLALLLLVILLALLDAANNVRLFHKARSQLEELRVGVLLADALRRVDAGRSLGGAVQRREGTAPDQSVQTDGTERGGRSQGSADEGRISGEHGKGPRP